MLDLNKIIDKQILFYTMFNNFNRVVKIDIKKDVKEIEKINNYNFTKKEKNHIIYSIITKLCDKKSLEWDYKNNMYIFYPVDHLKIFINNFYFVPNYDYLDEIIDIYKSLAGIIELNSNDITFLKNIEYKNIIRKLELTKDMLEFLNNFGVADPDDLEQLPF